MLERAVWNARLLVFRQSVVDIVDNNENAGAFDTLKNTNSLIN